MAKSIPSNATPAMLEWCRKHSGLSVADVAKSENVTPNTIASWESGKTSPSLAKLRKLALRYKYPVMVFYLEAPPAEFSVKRLKDFRTLASGVPREFSPVLLQGHRLAEERQAWAEEALGDEKAELPIIQASDYSPASAGKLLRSALGVTIEEQESFPSERYAFDQWRERAESLGVLVFQRQSVDIEEMRGMAIYSPTAPLVIINSRDTLTAKCFTLMHELAHLMLRESVITGSGSFQIEVATETDAERYCNQVAAEALVPEHDFRLRIPPNWRMRDDALLGQLSRIYRVSRAVIAIRLVECGYASDVWLRKKMPKLTPKFEDCGGPVDRHTMAMSRFGKYFTRLVLSQYHGDAIHGGELSSLLDMKLKWLPHLEAEMYPMRGIAIPPKEKTAS